MTSRICFLCVKHLILLVTFILLAISVSAQENQHFIVRPGDIIIDRIPLTNRYRFEQFRRARAHFVNNATASGHLNYNLLYGEMQFIDPTDDTVSLANEQMLEKISFEDTDYIFDPENNRYLEVLAGDQHIRLTRHLRMRLLEHDVKSMDGYVSTLNPNLSRAVYDLDNRVHQTTLREFFESRAQHPMLFSTHEVYYFVDKNNVAWPVKKSSLHRIFPDHRREISDYLSNHTIDFTSKEDLIQLISFCNQL